MIRGEMRERRERISDVRGTEGKKVFRVDHVILDEKINYVKIEYEMLDIFVV
jgi:hypothetical protein